MEVRNADRLDTEIPVMTRNVKLPDVQDNWKSATITNLSSSGAKLESMSKIGEKGDVLLVKFKLNICSQEEEMKLRAIIRQLEELADTGEDEWGLYVSGTQFQKHSRLEQVLLQNYVLERKTSYTL